jgi:hypothetical protein
MKSRRSVWIVVAIGIGTGVPCHPDAARPRGESSPWSPGDLIDEDAPLAPTSPVDPRPAIVQIDLHSSPCDPKPSRRSRPISTPTDGRPHGLTYRHDVLPGRARASEIRVLGGRLLSVLHLGETSIARAPPA